MITSYASVSNSDLRLELETATALCLVIDTPRALTVSLLLDYGEWAQYLALTIDASNYEDPSEFSGDYLVTEIMRKSPSMPLGIDRAEAGLHSFMSSEAQCKTTNQRLLGSVQPEWIHSFQGHISRILGPLPSDDLDFISREFRHGKGASTGVRGIGSTPSDKYDEEIHLTAELIPFFRTIIGERWWEHQSQPKTVIEGNRFTTVPKNAKTDRGICVEPTLNMYVQLGIGALIRRKLKRSGIDLDNQDGNRQLAQRAYRDNLATIDLSAASDSLSWGLVLAYFPERWLNLLSLARASFTKLPCGKYVELEKFSSMGNGFTFELETLVFYSVCATFIPKDELQDVIVYGDDIIIPTRYSTRVIDALEFLGFSVNTSKSFLAGNFFESCGTDWFKGHNVRPFHLKGSTDSIPYALQTANALRLYSRRIMGGHFCDARFRGVWLRLYESVHRDWRRCHVPMHFGDVGFIVSRKEAMRSAPRVYHGHEGYWCRHMASSPVKVRKETLGFLLSILARRVPPKYSFPTSGIGSVWWRKQAGLKTGNLGEPKDSRSNGLQAKRGYLGKLRTRWSNCHSWTNGLEWL